MILPPADMDHTVFIQSAIDSAGLAEVHLGPGLWRSGPLTLRTGLTLRLAKGATLRAIAEPERYPHLTHPVSSRMDAFPRRTFFFGDDLEDLTLCGEGLIDFSGGDPAFADGVGDSPDRPYGLMLVNCRNVRLEGLRLRNSAYWMARLLRCRDVRVTGLDIFNHCNLNNDGIDLDSCEDVLVSGCRIDSSDDGIVIKSETRHQSRNIIVADCFVSSHASAIKLGTASLGGFANILVHHCIIRPSRSPEMHHVFGYWRGMTGLDLASVDGGAARDIHFDHITIEGVANPIFVRLGDRNSVLSVPENRRRENAGPAQASGGPGAIERISFTAIHATEAGPIPSVFAGYEGHPIRDLTLRDIRIEVSETATFDPAVVPDWNSRGYPCARLVAGENGGLDAFGAVFRHVEGLVMENVNFNAPPTDPRAAISRHDIVC
jgi:hypothetical protein